MLNARSLRALQGVHPDLVRVAHRAAEIGVAIELKPRICTPKPRICYPK